MRRGAACVRDRQGGWRAVCLGVSTPTCPSRYPTDTICHQQVSNRDRGYGDLTHLHNRLAQDPRVRRGQNSGLLPRQNKPGLSNAIWDTSVFVPGVGAQTFLKDGPQMLVSCCQGQSLHACPWGCDGARSAGQRTGPRRKLWPPRAASRLGQSKPRGRVLHPAPLPCLVSQLTHSPPPSWSGKILGHLYPNRSVSV